MSCCGGRRRTLNGRRLLRPIRLRSVDVKPIRALGPRTGRTYDFTISTPENDVDPMDAPALLETGHFEKVF